MLSVKQSAERMGVCESVVYQLCSAGLLPHYRIGAPGKRGKVLIDAADLETFIESCKQEKQEGRRRSSAPARLSHLKL